MMVGVGEWGWGGIKCACERLTAKSEQQRDTQFVEEAFVTIAFTIALISNLRLGKAHFDVTVGFSTKMKRCEE